MLVLHGAWRPEEGGLVLWGEGDEIRRARRGKVLRHPFAAERGLLHGAWQELGGEGEGDAASDVHLLLPTAGGRPLASPERAWMDEETAPRDAKEVTLAEWVLPAQAVPPFAALRCAGAMAAGPSDGSACTSSPRMPRKVNN